MEDLISTSEEGRVLRDLYDRLRSRNKLVQLMHGAHRKPGACETDDSRIGNATQIEIMRKNGQVPPHVVNSVTAEAKQVLNTIISRFFGLRNQIQSEGEEALECAIQLADQRQAHMLSGKASLF